MKSKSSEVKVVSNLVLVAFILFLEEGFGGETFILFEGSSSSLGIVTFPLFYFTYVPSPPFSADPLSKSWTS
jgi:hypothetical protein